MEGSKPRTPHCEKPKNLFDIQTGHNEKGKVTRGELYFRARNSNMLCKCGKLFYHKCKAYCCSEHKVRASSYDTIKCAEVNLYTCPYCDEKVKYTDFLPHPSL